MKLLKSAPRTESAVPARMGTLERPRGWHSGNGGDCESCHKKREGMLQRAAISPPPVRDVPPIVDGVLCSPRQPLDANTRPFMKPRFGHDVSGLRVRTDATASESARAVNALAYTVGHDVVFDAGKYAPHTRTDLENGGGGGGRVLSDCE